MAQSRRNTWAASESYSPDNFYTRASDTKGHSTFAKPTRLEPAIVEQIQRLIETKQVPAWGSIADFIRDSMVHRLAWYRDNHATSAVRDQLTALLQRIHLDQLTDSYERELAYFSEFTERIKIVCERALQMKDTAALRLYLREVRTEVDESREPFRSSLFSLIEEYEARC